MILSHTLSMQSGNRYISQHRLRTEAIREYTLRAGLSSLAVCDPFTHIFFHRVSVHDLVHIHSRCIGVQYSNLSIPFCAFRYGIVYSTISHHYTFWCIVSFPVHSRVSLYLTCNISISFSLSRVILESFLQ